MFEVDYILYGKTQRLTVGSRGLQYHTKVDYDEESAWICYML